MAYNLEQLNGLSEEEREYALKLLSELSENGYSESYQKLLYEDYDEIPVDIITFVKDEKYLGKAWHSADGKCKLFPFWEEKLKEIFPDNISTNYNNAILSGARGLGKSEIAVTCLLYVMHRVMCLKNAHSYFDLKPTEKISFAFMNITKTLSEEIGISKFQNTVQLSPWFMSKGYMTQRDNEPYWNPPDYINIIIGSQPSHVIGQPILVCLSGDTEIYTDKGIKPLSDLVDKEIRVRTVSDDQSVTWSDICTVKPTVKSNDYILITLEDGSEIKCTPNHRFMLKDGTYKEAQYLTEDDDIMSKPPFGYIYKYTDLTTNKIYIGKREKPYFDESYWGSGKKWKKALSICGKNNVVREVLEWGYSREELNKLEISLIEKYNSTDDSIGYNVHKGGQGGNSLNDKEAWSLLHKGSLNGRYGKEVSEETRLKISKGNLGKKRSEEVKLKMSNSLKGKKKPEGFGEKVSIAQKGRVKSETELEHLRAASKVTAEKLKGRHIYNNGKVEKRFFDDDNIPEEFSKGRLKRVVEGMRTSCNLPKNYRWYNNGESEIYTINCPDGYIHGRLKHSEN